MSCLKNPPKVVMRNSFCQFVFDNADVNIDTIDGLNTFHAMGGIQCITLFTSMSYVTNIKKLDTTLTAQTIEEVDRNQLHTFQRTVDEELSNIKINDVNRKKITNEVKLLPSDFLW